MRVVLRLRFPLGRFHATPWNATPFDDPHGEWPPSPFRLLRSLVARWHQFRREDITTPNDLLDELIASIAGSRISFHLPATARRGPSIRQYQPEAFMFIPADWKQKGVPALKQYRRSLRQDNSWALAGDDSIFWLLEDAEWSKSSLQLLDELLSRMTYFGRAEAISEMTRSIEGLPDGIEVTHHLDAERKPNAAPVLCATPEVTRQILEAYTDDAPLKGASLPPGTALRFAVAERPPQPKVRAPSTVLRYQPSSLIQFAIGASVEPSFQSLTVMTSRFRGRVVREAVQLQEDFGTTWKTAKPETRRRIELLVGKDEAGEPLEGRRHANYLIWCEEQRLTRLLVYRATPFDQLEHDAIVRAARQPLAWSNRDAPDWRVQLIPLDRHVPPPPGFGDTKAFVWTSLTPYIPPRHVFVRVGKPKKGESIEEQVLRDLKTRGLPPAVVTLARHQPTWMQVHQPRNTRESEVTNLSRLGAWVRIEFDTPVAGPLLLGHSSFYGLGLFIPEISI